MGGSTIVFLVQGDVIFEVPRNLCIEVPSDPLTRRNVINVPPKWLTVFIQMSRGTMRKTFPLRRPVDMYGRSFWVPDWRGFHRFHQRENLVQFSGDHFDFDFVAL